MEVIEYIENIDDRMNRINKNYKYIGENIHNYINDGKIEYEQLMDFELALQGLSIELFKLVYLFNQIENNENNENPKIIKTNLHLSNNTEATEERTASEDKVRDRKRSGNYMIAAAHHIFSDTTHTVEVSATRLGVEKA